MTDDDPYRPKQTEAEAQSEETIMPWIWGAIGIVLIAIFVAWTVYGGPHSRLRQPAAAAPLTRPPAHNY
ncbi:MAG TPA: hypothetical protein VN694_06170 [Caulobacteraceae bacterium]|nr:hypothetical protein [Caulobacteraceae bacterium]